MLVFQLTYLFLSVQDPVISDAFADISQNPGNISKYQNDPKVKAVLEKLTKKFGGGGGSPFGGGAGGGAGGSPFDGAGGNPFGGGAPDAGTFTEQPDID